MTRASNCSCTLRTGKIVAMERLNQDEWLVALSVLNETASETSPDRDADLLRGFYQLLRAVPAGKYDLSALVDEAELEEALACEAFETAVLRIISPLMGFMLSSPPGPDREAIASVWLLGAKKEISASGPTMTRALVVAASAALCNACLENISGGGSRRTH